MALDTYANLKLSVASWAHRNDLTSVLDDFIDIVEARASQDLMVSQQETRATSPATTEYLALPADLLAIRNIQLNTSPVRELVYVTPAEMDRMDVNGTNLNTYTIVGDEIQLEATSSYTLEIDYYAKIPALSDANTTNWLLSAYPDIYLYGCLAEVFKYAMDEAQAMKYTGMYADSVRTAKATDKKRKYSQSMYVRPA